MVLLFPIGRTLTDTPSKNRHIWYIVYIIWVDMNFMVSPQCCTIVYAKLLSGG